MNNKTMSDLIELKHIRDNFQKNLEDWFDIAHSLIAIASIGADKIKDDMFNKPEASYSFSVFRVVNDLLGMQTLNNLKFKKIIEIYINNQGVIAELVYVRIIQEWYDFLNKIIEQTAKYHITGVKNYPNLPKVSISLDFSNENMIEEIPKLIREKFDFEKNLNKTKYIEKCLDRKLHNALKQHIKKSIVVRNVLEHNKGIVREKDIKEVGSESINLIDTYYKEKEFKPGEKFEITFYEIYRLKQAFSEAAGILIPN